MASCTTVLIADDDLFEADYVSAVLQARGIGIVGPIRDAAAGRAAVAAPGLCAAVVGLHADRAGLIAALEEAGVPYLTLLRATPRQPITDRPVLASPFAAYQVADWVLNTIGRRSGNVRPAEDLLPCADIDFTEPLPIQSSGS